MMEALMKVSAAAVTAALLAGVLKKNTPELALILVLAAGVWILLLAADGLGVVVALIRELAGVAGIAEPLLEPVVKTVALSILTRLTAELCRSAGEGGIAAFVETAGTVLALVVSVPLVQAVAQLMEELLT